MRLVSLALLLPLSCAFAPMHAVTRSKAFVLWEKENPDATTAEATALTDAANTVAEKIDDVLAKADDLVIRRVVRVVNTVPALYTLSELARIAGSSRFGIDLAPSALTIAAPLGLEIPVWVGYVLPVILITQVASLAKSALAERDDELSQSEVSQLVVSNICLARAVAVPNVINWAIAAVAAGYPSRKNQDGKDQKLTVHNASTRITASIATIATILGASVRIPELLPALQGTVGVRVASVTGLLGLYGLVTRSDNSKIKKTINAAIITGVVATKVVNGALSTSNVVNFANAVLVGTAYVGYLALDKARKALQ